MFEHHKQPLLPRPLFLRRALRYAFVSMGIVAVSLFLGMVGYHVYADITWMDSFYNASMILTGMGPGLDIKELPEDRQDPVRLFAGLYALYSGVVFLAASGLMFSPLLHRLLHSMHLEVED
ncbi:MAG: hypothetical protein IT270_03220 [Saprospiraceae bacterium]|nr:hypothetical protein [Saprospiraceae bacterium]